jgi:hypothetical protein
VGKVSAVFALVLLERADGFDLILLARSIQSSAWVSARSLNAVPQVFDIASSVFAEWFYRTNGNPGRDMELTARLYPKRQTMKDFVKANIDKIIPV